MTPPLPPTLRRWSYDRTGITHGLSLLNAFCVKTRLPTFRRLQHGSGTTSARKARRVVLSVEFLSATAKDSPMTPKERFAINLRRIRAEAGVSQEELGYMCDLH